MVGEVEAAEFRPFSSVSFSGGPDQTLPRGGRRYKRSRWSRFRTHYFVISQRSGVDFSLEEPCSIWGRVARDYKRCRRLGLHDHRTSDKRDTLYRHGLPLPTVQFNSPSKKEPDSFRPIH